MDKNDSECSDLFDFLSVSAFFDLSDLLESFDFVDFIVDMLSDVSCFVVVVENREPRDVSDDESVLIEFLDLFECVDLIE